MNNTETMALKASSAHARNGGLFQLPFLNSPDRPLGGAVPSAVAGPRSATMIATAGTSTTAAESR